MKQKHLLTFFMKARIPTKQPENNSVKTTSVPQIDRHVDMSIVYRTENPVSTASQAETQFSNGVDGIAAREAIANLRQSMGSMKQALDGLSSTIAEMHEVAEKNQGKIPDINRIVEEVLGQSSKGEVDS